MSQARTVYTVPSQPKEVRTEFLREAKAKGVTFLAELGEFFIAPAGAPDLVWATDISYDAHEVEIPSITKGADHIRSLASKLNLTRFTLLEGNHHRRATLIAEALRAREPEALSYLDPPKKEPIVKRAGFFLLTPETGIVLLDSITPYPGGGVPLREEKEGPPSRAYLKLWEAFARIGEYPERGARVLDLGSCPGGWTWALARLGCEVLSIDGAPIEPAVAAMPGVTFRKGDAFKLPPEKCDWVFSDMICEPTRLVTLLQAWTRSGACERFVISIKFKGTADQAAIDELKRIGGGGCLRHLRQNKHELTWISLPRRQDYQEQS